MQLKLSRDPGTLGCLLTTASKGQSRTLSPGKLAVEPLLPTTDLQPLQKDEPWSIRRKGAKGRSFLSKGVRPVRGLVLVEQQ